MALCCVVLFSVVLCCVVLCNVVLCCVMLFSVVLCCSVLCCVFQCCVVSSVLLCCSVLCVQMCVYTQSTLSQACVCTVSRSLLSFSPLFNDFICSFLEELLLQKTVSVQVSSSLPLSPSLPLFVLHYRMSG